MTESVKKLAPAIWQEIDRAKRVLLHFHPHPDPDSVGSALALGLALRRLGKEVAVSKGDSELPGFLGLLPGRELVVAKNILELDLAAYDLFVILDSGSLSQISGLGELVFPPTLTTVAIDHHSSNKGLASLNLIDPTYPATAQLLYDLLGEWQLPLDPDIALNLFLGIYTDTGGFKYAATNQDTFLAAAELAATAPNFWRLIFELENNETPQGLAFEALLLNTVATYGGGKIALATASFDELKAKGITPEFMHGGISGKLRSVRGWEIVGTLVEQEPGVVKVSLRTRDAKRYEVVSLATALGGGGHPAAAGATVRGSPPEVRERLLQVIARQYPDLA